MFKLTFDLDNDAFQPDPAEEICRILAEVSRSVANGITRDHIRDVNGNKVGEWTTH